MVGLTALNKPNLLYISPTKSARTSKGNPFLYFQFEDFKAFQLFKLKLFGSFKADQDCSAIFLLCESFSFLDANGLHILPNLLTVFGFFLSRLKYGIYWHQFKKRNNVYNL